MKWRIARFGDFSGQKMKIVDELVCPHASYMLVEAHGPKRHDLALWIGVQLGQLLEKPTLNAALLGNAIERVVLHKSSVGLEVDGLRCAGSTAPLP